MNAQLTAAGRRAFRKAHGRHLRGVREAFLDKLDDQQLQQLAGAWKAIGVADAPDLGHGAP